jgi:hypothetical protein
MYFRNHLGQFLLAGLLLPCLLKSQSPRVVAVSSELHRNAAKVRGGQGHAWHIRI